MTFPLPYPREPGNTRLFMPMAASNAWQLYRVPAGAYGLQFTLIGGGGAGGAGFSALATLARGGGGGGGCGGMSGMLIADWLLPEELWVFVGISGVSAGGGDTTISLQPTNTGAANLLLRANGGGLGGTGTGTAVGAAGVLARASR